MEENKQIKITGTHNRYMIKKTTYKNEKNKTRVQSLNWSFDEKYYCHNEQLQIISLNNNNEIYDIIKQQLIQKINCYKQQDIKKKIFDNDKFLKLDDVIQSLQDCHLKCHYCTSELLILYDKSREGKQWTIDRINNDLGHNLDNYYIACLDCNLKRRRQNDGKFLFTKQLCIKKI